MEMRRFAALLAVSCALLFSCDKTTPEKKPDPKPNPDPTPQVDEINGTKIQEGMTAVGLIKNASTGKGIPGIPVTDGYTYVVTDANGVYQMAANRMCRKVYMSVPSEYKIPLDPSTHLPLFYSQGNYDKKIINRFDFTLEPLPAPEENFTLIMIGDPQCQTTSDSKRYETETIPDIKSTLNTYNAQGLYKNPYAVTLGDVTFDSCKSGMFDIMKQTMSNVKLQSGEYLPFFQCIGNHDHNSLVSSGDYEATELYVNTFGPTDYSFNRGKVHIIVMDDIIGTSVTTSSGAPNGLTWKYDDGLTKQKYKWLEEDLAQISDKANKTVILCMHIQIRNNDSNEETYFPQTLKLFKEFKDAHIMIGHTHYPQNYIHAAYRTKSGRMIYEHIHGAACGGWWCCNSNVTGAPNGYSIYEIEGSTIKNWIPKGTNRQMDYQIRVYDGNQIYSGSKQYLYSWYTNKLNGNTINVGGSGNYAASFTSATKDCFVAEIWDDDSYNWTVEMFKDGEKLGSFSRIPDKTCCNIAITSYFFNELNKNSDTWTNKTASHYWYFKPTGVLPADMTGWEVRATQTIPDSGQKNTYYCNSLTTDYSDF